ncbi:MAG TPA: FAD-dependent oxidoreductase [Candidatus Saccharimonadia bacterium]|jgi:NADH dehydrogenase
MSTSTQNQRQSKVVIVGGGFGGVRIAHKLARHSNLDLTLISIEDSFAYYPQLYHSATGGSRSESSIPLAELLGGLPVRVVRDTVTKLDPDHNTITTASGASYAFDELVLSLGSITNYFGIEGLKEFSYGIKSIAGAERFKQHLHRQLVEEKRTDLNYVVVGAGPTGVELAAALGSYLHRITRLHGLDKPQYKIDLIEAAPRILPRSPEAVSVRVQRQLESLGVTVMTGQTVKGETAEALTLGNKTLQTKTVVWTAGVANNPFFKDNASAFTINERGKVQVDEHLQARPHVYVLGDNAATQFSGMAQTALYDADYAAADLARALAGHPRPAYKPKAPISVIPVGEHWATAEWGSLKLYGMAGYILRRLADLVGYADIESWPKAIKLWLQDGRREDLCPICSGTPATTPIDKVKAT